MPESGIYRVTHDSHRLMHEATLLQDQRFPICKSADTKSVLSCAAPSKILHESLPVITPFLRIILIWSRSSSIDLS